MSDDIHLLCGFDDAYAPHFAMMISSLITECRNPRSLKIHLVSNLLSDPIRHRLDQILTPYNIGTINWLHVDLAPFRDAPISMHFTLATYAKIAAFDQIPAHRALYLDVDLVCIDDVASLFHSDLQGKTLGAILDPNNTFDTEHKTSLGMSKDALCFNGGVLLVDTALWKKNALTQTCINYMRNKGPAIRWVDQDVLNGVFENNWTRLPSHWNVQTHFWKDEFRSQLATRFPEELHVTDHPKIVHFNDPHKPWHLRYPHPYRLFYLKYLALSGWPHGVYHILKDGKNDQLVIFS